MRNIISSIIDLSLYSELTKCQLGYKGFWQGFHHNDIDKSRIVTKAKS